MAQSKKYRTRFNSATEDNLGNGGLVQPGAPTDLTPEPKYTKRQISMTPKASINFDEFGEIQDVNEYRIIDPLGSGSFAEVHLCEKPVSREKFALKVFNKSKLVRQRSGTFGPRGLLQVTTAMDQVAEEIAIMKKLEHRNLVSLHEVIDDETSDSLFLVLEYVSGGVCMAWNDWAQRFDAQFLGDRRVAAQDGEGGETFHVYSDRRAASIVKDVLQAKSGRGG